MTTRDEHPDGDGEHDDGAAAEGAQTAPGDARELGDLDSHSIDVAPEAAVAESLRQALDSMREEATRIDDMGASDEQVAAAEQFAEDAGALDEQIGRVARTDDDGG